MAALISVTNLVMITGERTYHRRKRFCDGLHIGIPERLNLRLGAGAVAADDKGPSSPFLGAGRLRVWGFMLSCGIRERLRGRLPRHSRLTMGKRRMIARLNRLQICTCTPSSRQGRRCQIAARMYFMIPVGWRWGCRRQRNGWVSATNCGTS
jgi:hypothetical protein